MKLLKTLLSIICGLLAIFVGLVFLMVIGGVIVALRHGVGEDETTALKAKSDHGVAMIELTGEIITSDDFRTNLKRAVDSKSIKAVLVRIDSPGGAVGASEEIYRLIRDANEKKPVVCSMGNLAASGGLFASLGCKKVIANESTLTGSIGVIIMSPNFHSVMEKFGVSMTVVKSGKYKDTGSPFREFSEEDRAFMQSVIDSSYQQFVRTVAESRGLSIDAVKKFADGRIILGSQAKELGLVDEIGGIERAAKVALELAGDQSPDFEIVRVKKAQGLMAYFSSEEATQILPFGIFRWLKMQDRVQLLYRAFL